MEKSFSDSVCRQSLSPADAEFEKKNLWRRRATQAVSVLTRNGFHAYYADTRQAAEDLLINLIPQNSTVSCTDKTSPHSLYVEGRLLERGGALLPGIDAEAGTSPIELREILIRRLLCDVALLDIDAVTMNGEIVMSDHEGAEIFGSVAGPRRTISEISVDHLVDDLSFLCAADAPSEAAIPFPWQEDTCTEQASQNAVTIILRKAPQHTDYHIILVGET